MLKEEVEKLLAANFIKEVECSAWLANVVMVNKSNGKWCMCTNYIDLKLAQKIHTLYLALVD